MRNSNLERLEAIYYTEKKKKTKYLTGNSISLRHIKCYSSNSSRSIKSPSNSIQYNSQKICNWFRRPKVILEIKKRPHFFMNQQVYHLPVFLSGKKWTVFLQWLCTHETADPIHKSGYKLFKLYFKNFTNCRRKTKRVVVFSCTPFFNTGATIETLQ